MEPIRVERLRGEVELNFDMRRRRFLGLGKRSYFRNGVEDYRGSVMDVKDLGGCIWVRGFGDGVISPGSGEGIGNYGYPPGRLGLVNEGKSGHDDLEQKTAISFLRHSSPKAAKEER